MKLQGKIKINDISKAEDFISSYHNLLRCVPGVKEIDGNRFTAKSKIGFLTIETDGEVKAFNKGDNWSETVIEIIGAGVKAIVRSLVKIQDHELVYDVDYDVDVQIPALKNFVEKQVSQLTKQILECTAQAVS
ncbi:SRPBCC domain-containing protein [Sulfurisphaera javensis]|uniref:SRPBCC domain-containing protein n=1 Tax=Sulfurisphaera javensis TaxID=2049879 RepID=A0AAT9GSN0_9CREN